MAKAVGHAGASWVQRGEASAHVDYTGQVRVFRQAPCYIPPGVLAVWPSYCPPPPRVSVLYPKLEGRGKVRAGHSGSVRRQIQAQAQGPGGVLGAQGTPTPRLSSMLTALAPESQPWRLQTPDPRIPCLVSLQPSLWLPHPAGRLCSPSPDTAWLSRPLRRQTESARHLEQMVPLLKITLPCAAGPGDRRGCGWGWGPRAALTSHLHRDRCECSLPRDTGPGDPSLTDAVQSHRPAAEVWP